ncbi:MAG: hypothetical protein Q9218_001983 [Villophora microphyllina]
MPGVVAEHGGAKKKKRKVVESELDATRRSKTRRLEKIETCFVGTEEEILLLESQILQSRKHYNSIATLLRHVQTGNGQDNASITAAVALCRVFCRLMAVGSLSKSRGAPESEITIVQWLRGQFEAYKQTLLDLVSTTEPTISSTALTLLMRLLKGETESLDQASEDIWHNGTIKRIVSRLVAADTAGSITEEFVEKYLQPFDDVRYHAFACLNDLLAGSTSEDVVDNVISMMAILDIDLERKESFDNFFVEKTKEKKHKVVSLTAHKKQAQELWLRILNGSLTKHQRKTILGLMSHQIAPWFMRIELLMDFLTDSFNAGGSIALLALSGLFHLIHEKNLDYPQFYTKLYSLLSSEILHSKHRSRFFRLLDTFLSSTHLPAGLVASFIKRLARLSLCASPSGIVVVVPWIYNLLKNHPSCTFMIHRKPEHSSYRPGEGMDDPFNMEEQDPMETHAIESSLWEIHTLQSHYHPNVATIAKITSEQFTKQAYNLEDFLDHSYSSMLTAELSKEIKKPPVIEYEIPKKIFLKHTDPAQKNSLLVSLWDFA